MKFELSVDPRIMSTGELQARLESISDPSHQVGFHISRRKVQFRNADAAIIVAIVGGITSSLVAFINLIATIANKTVSKKIILQSQSGNKLEIPAGTKPDEVEILMEELKKMDQQKIHIEML